MIIINCGPINESMANQLRNMTAGQIVERLAEAFNLPKSSQRKIAEMVDKMTPLSKDQQGLMLWSIFKMIEMTGDVYTKLFKTRHF